MKAYIAITGAIFGLITIAHIWRLAVEPHVRTEASYIVLTLLTATMLVWAMLLLTRRSGR